jgi:hypothetical protein
MDKILDKFIISYDHRIKMGDNEVIKKMCSTECCCTHRADLHNYTVIQQSHLMQDMVVFTRCSERGCSCGMFKRDNLKYLEELTNG